MKSSDKGKGLTAASICWGERPFESRHAGVTGLARRSRACRGCGRRQRPNAVAFRRCGLPTRQIGSRAQRCPHMIQVRLKRAKREALAPSFPQPGKGLIPKRSLFGRLTPAHIGESADE